MKTYRMGVIGGGMIGYWHAEAIRQLPNAELVGVCDHGSGRAEKFGPRCGCAAGVCGLERFIARDGGRIFRSWPEKSRDEKEDPMMRFSNSNPRTSPRTSPGKSPGTLPGVDWR